MKYFIEFLIGFTSSIIIIISIPELFGSDKMNLIEYIGFGFLFGTLYLKTIMNNEIIDKLEKRIEELEKQKKN